MEFTYTDELQNFLQLIVLSMSLSAIVIYLTELIKKNIKTTKTGLFTALCFMLSAAFGVGWALTFSDLPLNYALWLGLLIFLGSSGFYKTLEQSDSWLGRTVKSYSEYVKGGERNLPLNADEESGELTAAASNDDVSPNESSAQNGLEAGYVSANFKKDEFGCKCGKAHCDGYNGLGENAIDTDLIAVLQRARDHFKKPLVITSGIRCETRNAEVGGVSTSRHLKGKAADCYIGSKAGVSDEELCAYFKEQPEVRYSYTGFGAVHIDVK